MRTIAGLFATGVMFSVAFASPALAQPRVGPHIVDAAAVRHAVEQQAASADADRAAIHEALGRAEVQELAKRLGADAGRLNSSVDTLGGHDLATAADAARRVNAALVGGASSVTLSTTTIIIGLLVLILIIVAVK